MTQQPTLNTIEATIAEVNASTPPEASGMHAPDTHVSDPSVEDARVSGTSVANTSAPDWREGLPDDLKNAPSLVKFKDQASLVKSYLESEKAFSSRVAIPKDDAADTEWDAFYKKIGRPEDKRYRPENLSIGEDEEPILARYEDILHSSGLTRKQGQKVLGHMIDLSAQMENEAKTRQETARTENLKILEQTFGGEMDLKMKQIKAALGQFGNHGLAALVEQTNYHPGLVQFLSGVGEKLASDRLVTGDSPSLSTSRQTALDEIKKLETDEAFQVDYRGSDFEKRQKAVSRINQLYNTAYRSSSHNRSSDSDQQTSDI